MFVCVSLQMVRMQSPRVQCCLCAFSVFASLFGMFMTSAGVCLVLNYNLLSVDTSGLPPNLHNDEGKKVVGIILICIGVAALLLSGLVSALYFTACTNKSSPPSASSVVNPKLDPDPINSGTKRSGARPSSTGYGNHNSNSHHRPGSAQQLLTAPTNTRITGPHPNGRVLSGSRLPSVVNGKRLPPLNRAESPVINQRLNTPPGGIRSHGQKSRSHAKKGSRHPQSHSRFSTHLAPHPEECAVVDQQSIGDASFDVSFSTEQRTCNQEGYVNLGADLTDDFDKESTSACRQPPDSTSPSSSILIRVAPSPDQDVPQSETPPDEQEFTTTLPRLQPYPRDEGKIVDRDSVQDEESGLESLSVSSWEISEHL